MVIVEFLESGNASRLNCCLNYVSLMKDLLELNLRERNFFDV